MTELDLSDIQGIVTRAYKTLPSARFLLMRINDAEPARAWLDTIAGSVTAAVGEPTDQALNVAFTSIGLTALGLDRKTSETFGFEFSEGMTAEGNTVCCWGHARQTFRGSYLGFEPTGRSARHPFVSVFEARNGKLVRERYYFDLAQLCTEIGLPVGAVSERLAVLKGTA